VDFWFKKIIESYSLWFYFNCINIYIKYILIVITNLLILNLINLIKK